MNRRRFLQLTGSAATALCLPARDALAAQPWGTWPAAHANLALPQSQQAENVLEFFMVGGMSPWETVYAVDDEAYGKKKKWMLYSHMDGPNGILEWQKKCAGGQEKLTLPFAKDSNGAMVGLGPFIKPLRDRPDITSRMRVHVLQHDLVPHDPAFALSITGSRLGDPRMSGVGAHVQRHFREATKGGGDEPRAVVLRTQFRYDGAVAAGISSGMHPGAARPLILSLTGTESFVHALKRLNLGKYRGDGDKLLSFYADEYRNQLRSKPAATPVRSAGLEEYLHALHTLQNQTGALIKLLDNDLVKVSKGGACGITTKAATTPLQMKVAAHLLTSATSKVRHVSVFDQALVSNPGDFAHDTHVKHNEYAAPNYHYAFSSLCERIKKPGEQDPTKIDLDKTLVIVNTEFGRTPWGQNQAGRNHHPYAYATMMFGGPINTKQKGIVGAINPDGTGKDTLHPAETRAAVLMAMGIWPFALNGYSVSQIHGAKTDAEAAKKLRQTVLGV